ncbi:MAG: hypothetical protein K2X82_05290 [Gemmataceae bacterium]|nr:hypothetical protein [Gemmataceae bacterium]
MLGRFRRIRDEFGTPAAARTALLLIGLLGMAIFGWAAFSSPWPAVVAAVGLLLGFVLQSLIVRGVEYYSAVVPVGLVIYGLVLFGGERVGLSREARLLIITATTVIVFGIQFWSLSDPSVVNTVPRNRG